MATLRESDQKIMDDHPREAVEAPMDLVRTTLLEAVQAKVLNQKNENFAASLAKSTYQWTEKQEVWARWLYALSLGLITPDSGNTTEIKGGITNIIALFAKAKEHVKYPSISLQFQHLDKTHDLVLKPSTKYPGDIQMTDGSPYPSNVWYGRISSTGNWIKNKSLGEPLNTTVEHLLNQLAHDPVGTAKQYGSLTGRCCFCNLPLSDEHSTSAGFGPVCAKNFGLYQQWKSAKPVLNGEISLPD